MAEPKVFVATCYPWHGPSASYHESMVRQLFADFGDRMLLFGGGHLALISGPRIASARNEICRAFLNFPTQPDYLWFVDSDMAWSPDVLYKLVDTATENDLPILGGLCFGGGVAGSVFPTLYRMVNPAENPERNPVEVICDYPKDSLVKVDATGAACLLIRRDVIEKMFEVHGTIEVNGRQVPNAAPWFAETMYHGHEFSEDWSWCMRAQMLGYPIHVHTGITMGHQKTQIIDEDVFDSWMDEHKAIGSGGQREKYLRQTGQLVSKAEKPGPTFAIIPVKGRYDFTRSIIAQCYAQNVDHILVFDNSDGTENDFTITRKHLEKKHEQGVIELIDAKGWRFHDMWKAGVDKALACSEYGQVAFLNNDVKLSPNFFAALSDALRADRKLWVVGPNWDDRKIPKGVAYVEGSARNGGISGWAWMAKLDAFAEGALEIVTEYDYWYGEDDLFRQVQKAGYKLGIVEQVGCVHIDGGSQTLREVLGELSWENPVLYADAEKFAARWGLSMDSPEGW